MPRSYAQPINQTITMNKLAKMLGVNDAEAGRPMDDSCFETEQEKVFYRSAYETRQGEMWIETNVPNWAPAL